MLAPVTSLCHCPQSLIWDLAPAGVCQAWLHPWCFSWLCGRRAEGRGQQSEGAPSRHRALCTTVLPYPVLFQGTNPTKANSNLSKSPKQQILTVEWIFWGRSFVFTSVAIFIINGVDQTVVQQLRVGKGTPDPCSHKNRAGILLLQQNLPGKAQPSPHCPLGCW